MSNQTNTCARCSDDCHSIRRALEIENAELRTALDYLSGTCQQLADEANKTYADSAISCALELLSKSKGAE